MPEPIPWTPALTVPPAPASARRNGSVSAVALTPTELLPRSLSSVFDEAFDFYKRHFLQLALIVALVFIPTQIVLTGIENIWLRPLMAQYRDPQNLSEFGNLMVLMVGVCFTGVPKVGIPGLLSMLTLVLASGPLSAAVSDLYLGRATTPRAAFRRALPHLPRLLGVWMLSALGFLCIASVSFVLFLMTFSLAIFSLGPSNLPNEIATLLLLGICFLPYGLGKMLTAQAFLFFTPLVVLEGLPFGAVPGRNSQIVGKSGFLRAWSAAVFLPLVTLGLTFLILQSVESALDTFRLAPLLSFLAGMALSSLIAFFFQPYWMICLTLLYYDARVRREGLDVRTLLESSTLAAAPISPDSALQINRAAAYPVPPPSAIPLPYSVPVAHPIIPPMPMPSPGNNGLQAEPSSSFPQTEETNFDPENTTQYPAPPGAPPQ